MQDGGEDLTNTIIRPAVSSDEAFLRRMVFIAWRWDRAWDETAYAQHRFRNEPDTYVDGFGDDAGDLGAVAEVDGEPAGAAWCRLLTAQAARSGHVDDAFPELVIGVVDELRGLGLGRRLLEAMIEACRLQGVEAVSLHVARRNHRARRMYERLGFETVREHTSGTVMILRLIV